ncbi:hypothetical protein TVAG_064560 [Trichomonas vaginalis G3]|uniref:Uncharacterized protein n=1 Tax=Trichomonas vaginalis (strain ATCC PRA-98 / G3) TaxID=412133 RepID=A2EHD1_TRIV3|nr:hypothetical protein TVAGG3_0350110 [Trichomonas vaginalis G3]EAY07909.1 hypothetical protein TVAG_064560 [Trichomonas vaginalis G3]KAI5531221.1 hypothetical protein TVAGG3_0350110 [Trichomonas vaginalis G3]|eukprot:XP_001320132.1 hypothetical protein [Trichomonas vaginalis G3]
MGENLAELLAEIKKRVIPSAFEKKCEVSQTLTNEQRKIIILGRGYYHVLYKLLFLSEQTAKLSYNTLMKNVMISEKDYIPTIDPLPTQIIINLLKLIYQQPRIFAISLIESSMPEKEFINFAFTTFPALFGFFTSQEFSEPAGLLVLDLIQAGGPDYMVENLTNSLLYSSINFIESFWCEFSREFTSSSSNTLKSIHESLVNSLNICVKLLPASIFFICRELASCNVELLFRIVFLSFLPQTFSIWSSRSPFGLSLTHPNLVIKYFQQNNTWPNENAVCILNAITKNVARVNKTPVFSVTCKLPYSLLIFSKKDVLSIYKAFKTITSKIQLFNELENSGKSIADGAYEPFMIQFFHRISPQRSKSFDIIPIPRYLCETFKPNSYLENAYVQYTDLLSKGYTEQTMHQFFRSSEFQRYKEQKELSILDIKIDDQNEAFKLSMAKYDVVQYEKTLYSLFSQTFGLVIYDMKISKLHPVTLTTIFDLDSIIDKYIYGRDHLRSILFIEMLNTFRFENIIPIEKRIIEKVTYSIAKIVDPMDNIFSKSIPLSSLAMLFNKRIDIKAGQFLILISFVIENVILFSKPPCAFAIYNPTLMMKYIIRMSILDRDIFAFIFLEKIFLRSNFIRRLPPSFVNSLNMYVQTMWELIGTDESSLADVLSYEIKNL